MFLCNRHSASFTSFNSHPEPWSRHGNQHGLHMGKLRLAEQKSFAQGHLACKCQSWVSGICTWICPSSGSLSKQPPRWLAAQSTRWGGLCPWAGAISLQSPCPSFHQGGGSPVSIVAASPSAPQEGVCLWGPGRALTRGLAQQDQRCTLLLPHLLNLPLPPPPSF